jgi:cyanophycinase
MKRFAFTALLFTALLCRAGEDKPLHPVELHPFPELALPALQEPLGGTLILHGGGKLSPEITEGFLRLAGGESARIAVIPTAGEDADKATAENRRTLFGDASLKELFVLHTNDRARADSEEFSAPLRNATGVWIEGGQQARLEAIYGGTQVERELLALVARGGVIFGTSAGAAIFSKTMIRSDNPARPGAPSLGRGFAFLENIIVDQHFAQRIRRGRLEKAITQLTRGYAGLGIDEDTAVVVLRRTLVVIGNGNATMLLPASAQHPQSEPRPMKIEILKPRKPVDLLAISRAALARAEGAFPPKVAPAPEVPEGGLLVIGGSGISDEGTRRFLEHIGGVTAPIVVVSTALDDDPPAQPYEFRLLQKLGATDVTVVHARTRADSETAAVLDPIRRAKGLWFSGGRQWRLVDKYLGTAAEREMHALLARGGAIAGGSAGATIQGDYLVRGNPLGNMEMMVEGYEQGLGFLKGVAVDQHFTQRNRFSDMTAFKAAVPQYLGIGLDENTALVVKGHIAEVVGEHAAAFYGESVPPPEGKPEFVVVKSGESYDLKERRKRP